MDGADAFLHRKEAKAIKRRTKEPIVAMAAVHCEDKNGLLSVTPTHILFSYRKGLGAKVMQWKRKDLGGVRLQKRRYGIIQIRVGKKITSFDTTQRGDAERLHLALVPKARKTDSVTAAIKAPVHSKAEDPLAHRGTPAHRAKLQDMVDRGLMTKKEMEWQLA